MEGPIFPGVRLLVFDLDCTITNKHTCPVVTARDIEESLLELYIQADLFQKFVQYLLDSGIEVAIATYGRKEVALALMNRVFGDRSPFHDGNVITPADVSFYQQIKWRECYQPPKEQYNKNNMLSILSGQYSLIPPEILLVDDDSQNVLKAKEAGYRAVLVPKCEGFRQTLAFLLGSVLSQDQINSFVDAL